MKVIILLKRKINKIKKLKYYKILKEKYKSENLKNKKYYLFSWIMKKNGILALFL